MSGLLEQCSKKKFSACDLWERRCVYCQLLSHLKKKKKRAKQKHNPKNCQWNEGIRTEQDLQLLRTSVYFSKASDLVESSQTKSHFFLLKSICMLYALWFLLSCWCLILKRACVLLFTYSSSCSLDEFQYVYISNNFWLRSKQRKQLGVTFTVTSYSIFFLATWSYMMAKIIEL